MLKFIRNTVLFITLALSSQVKASLEIVITEGIDSARPVAILPFTFKGATLPSQRLDEVIAEHLKAGPQAVREAKKLIADVLAIDGEARKTARQIAANLH